MKAQINLASEPFRRDRLVLVSSAGIAALLVVLLGVLLTMVVNDRASMQSTLNQLEAQNRLMTRLDAEQARLNSELRLAGNADVLERSQFINTLLYRKGISWTRLFGDLEKVLPPTVRIIQIRPQVDSKDHILLDLVVGASAEPPMIDLVTKLESSDLFGSTEVHAVIPPSQTDPLYRYRLTVSYAQKL